MGPNVPRQASWTPNPTVRGSNPWGFANLKGFDYSETFFLGGTHGRLDGKGPQKSRGTYFQNDKGIEARGNPRKI